MVVGEILGSVCFYATLWIMASPCSALTRCVVPLSLSFLLHPSLPHLGKSLSDLSDASLFSSVVGDAGVLGIKAQLSLLADHETTAAICMGSVGLGKEKDKGVLCCGKEFCIQERPGWCLFQRVKCLKGSWLKTVTSTHLPVVVSLLILSESPDTPHHKQNGVLEKNPPDPLGSSFEMTSQNSCFLQFYLMFNLSFNRTVPFLPSGQQLLIWLEPAIQWWCWRGKASSKEGVIVSFWEQRCVSPPSLRAALAFSKAGWFHGPQCWTAEAPSASTYPVHSSWSEFGPRLEKIFSICAVMTSTLS